MIQLEWRSQHQGRLDALIEEIGRTDKRFRVEARQLLIEGNERDRMTGRDRTGTALRPWRVRRGKYAGASGPTLAPFRQASRSVSAFFAEWRGNRLVAGFRGPGVEVLAYHAAGKSGTGRKGQVTGIVRDIFGVSPQTVADLRAEYSRSFRAVVTRAAKSAARRAASFFGGLFT